MPSEIAHSEVAPAIVLVHGYLGAPRDLDLLRTALAKRFPAALIEVPCLPGHGTEDLPTFAAEAFLSALTASIDRLLASGRPLILIGHSTGGSLLLAELARRQAAAPASLEAVRLLVLCATPPRIDLGYAARWAAHTQGRVIPIDDVGALVSLVNRLARRQLAAIATPVLLVHGEDDELVPVADLRHWSAHPLIARQRQVRVAEARHHLFCGEPGELAGEAICRAIGDALVRYAFADASSVEADLGEVDDGLLAFLSRWPDSAAHLLASPAVCRAQSKPERLAALADTEPTLANIEITTRCNLGCAACARTALKLKSAFMSRADFERTLALLPHAYRIVLVGLGEPLLHPELVDFIRLAVSYGRRVGLVTNGMLLNADMSKALCESGLSSVTFSIDAIDQGKANAIRAGSDMALIGENLARFDAVRRRFGKTVGLSVFTALSAETLTELAAIIDFAADRGVDAMMVSDLNFSFNQARSVQAGFSAAASRIIRSAIKRAVARRLPVLSVRALEELALEQRYLDHLLLRGEPLAHRSARRSHCVSPWQSLPVRVDGTLTLCDCQPMEVIGSILRQPLSAWWNGPLMLEHRRRMLGDDPPPACRQCPRF